LLPLSATLASETLPEETSEGWDMSNFLLNRNGVLPIPIFITEPAICCGLLGRRGAAHAFVGRRPAVRAVRHARSRISKSSSATTSPRLWPAGPLKIKAGKGDNSALT
jgi:hypothetical protein